MILSGCGVFNDPLLKKKSENLKGESIEISNFKEVSKADNILAITVNVPSPYINSYGYYGCIDAETKYIDLKYGELSLGYSNRMLIDTYNFDPPDYSDVGKVNKNNFQIIYGFPLFTRSVSRYKQVAMKKITKSPNGYYTILKTNLFNKYNLRLGYSQVYSETNSLTYTKFLAQKYNNIHFADSDVEYVDALVHQNSKMIKLGISSQNIINTTFNADDKNNEQYYGRSSSITDFYFDVNFLLSSNMADVRYYYSIYDPGPDFGLNVNENVLLSSYIKKKPMGFSFGIEQINFGLNHANFCNKLKFEFGINPGYYDSNFKAFYIKFSMVGLGFGKM